MVELPGSEAAFYMVAQREAEAIGLDADTHLANIESKARAFILSGELVGREDFSASIKEAVSNPGNLTLVLGGKSIGKSLVREHVVKELREEQKVVVLDVDMRQSERPLFEQLTIQARECHFARSLFWAPDLAAFLAAACAAFCDTFLVSAASQTARGIASILQRQQGVLLNFLREVRLARRHVVIIVDEANMAIPGPPEAADQVLQFIVAATKQTNLASIVLITSDYTYPYRLRESGLKTRDMQTVILAGEVPEAQMMDLLIEKWGMGPELAGEFFRFFGGHVYLSYKGVSILRRITFNFDPLALLDVPDLQSCVELGEGARGHLKNLVEHGFSHVTNIKEDSAAKEIVKADLASIIRKDSIVFDCPPGLWTGNPSRYALLPESKLCRLVIAEALQLFRTREQGN